MLDPVTSNELTSILPNLTSNSLDFTSLFRLLGLYAGGRGARVRDAFFF